MFWRFLLNGGLATALHYLVFLILLSLGIDGIVATCIGAFCGLMVNYLLQYYRTFGSSIKHKKAFIRFVGVASLSFYGNALLFTFFQSMMSVHELLVQLMVTTVLTIANFFLYKKVFSHEFTLT